MGRSEDADTLTSVTSEETKSDKLALVPATKYRKATQEVRNHQIAIDGVDVDEWAKSVPDDGSVDEQTGSFNRMILLISLKPHCVVPTNGLYKVHPGQASDLDWLECNMAGLFDLDPAHVPQLRPPDFEAYKSGRQPSVLFVPEAPINFVIESTPLQNKPIDLTHKLSSSEPRRSPRCKTHSEDGRWNSKDKSAGPGPPPCDPNAHDSVLTVNPVYKNLNSVMKLRKRNWERLRMDFKWLPKLDIQRLFPWNIAYLARSPVETHHEHKYHLLPSSLESICHMLGTVGIAEHPGCHMAYKFLFLETDNFLFPSEICSARSPITLHKRLDLPDGEELTLPTIISSIDLSDGEELTIPTKIKSRDNRTIITVVYSSDHESDIEDVLLGNCGLIGQTFLLSQDEGYVRCAKIVELNYKHNCNRDIQPTRIQLCLNIDKGEYERVMAYHEIHVRH
ncbi:unnamed protein product [Cylindrotheca closterium]|uniref:Uncharacterized protein n=1 Tax=Cylindrotheca closterium TaxID=2856 RepID=A0AAD2G040_9STRA|nr:unnamed protein product [Cylindrotheca closterium]